ncbi:MAG: hypothetical protein DI582_06045, partial [Azospirillum brasilense]
MPVKLYEASTSAGGRVRSSAGQDHGLHLFSGAAREFRTFLKRIDAQQHFTALPPRLRIHDARSGEDIFINLRAPRMAAPLVDHVQLLGHLLQPSGLRAEELLSPDSPLQDALLAPASRLVLNQPAHAASARQFQRVVRRLLRRGALQFYSANAPLQQAVIAPALARLEYLGGSVYFGQALKGFDSTADGVSQLHFARKKFPLSPGDVLILATPAPVTQNILKQVHVPAQQHSAITLHYTVEHREPVGQHIVLTNGVADLLRYDAGGISASIRVAEHCWARDEETLARSLWQQLQALHPYLKTTSMPGYSSWREKRAGHVPQDEALPPFELPPRVLLAGDWLDATRPATMEAAALHGHRAADAALALLGKNPLPSQHDFYLNSATTR